MANKSEENKKTSSKKTNTNKKSTTTKTNKTGSKKTNTNKANATKKTSTSNTTTKKTSSSKNEVKKTNTTKKSAPKKVEKELEKTVIIEDIENKISGIVENRNVEEKNKITNDVKLENAKYKIRKRNKQLLAIGVVISLLGIIALVITLIANRIVDKEFISDNAIVMMVIASILIEIFGAFIIVNES